ncbi:uncharacterized protein LOC130828688 [Amaranthus tricolor]|uniref:uncharacterized protein LOC130828688 n=1 Tax=Amaranthus tricolor TaxID=29722 RepID=UPI00258D3BE2|nr:uncharacterized protein LOC130828688 [Amaranthus tricolor]
MKTPRSSKTPKTGKISQPQPLSVVHPPPLLDAAPSSTTETTNETPKPSTEHAGTKRQIPTPKGGSSSRIAKRSKHADPNSTEEVSKEMSVGFGLDKYCTVKNIAFSGINGRTILKFLGVDQKKGKISHNVLSPLHKLLYNVARRFILPRNSKRSEKSFVGYGGLLTWVFRKFDVSLEEEVVEIESEEEGVEEEEEEKEKSRNEEKEKKEHEPVPTDNIETGEKGEQDGEASKGETGEQEEALEDNVHHNLCSDSSYNAFTMGYYY